MHKVCYLCKYYQGKTIVSICTVDPNHLTEKHCCEICEHYVPDPDKLQKEYDAQERLAGYVEEDKYE